MSAWSLLLHSDEQLTKPHRAAAAWETPARGCLKPPRLCPSPLPHLRDFLSPVTQCRSRVGTNPASVRCHIEYDSHVLSFNNHASVSVREDIKIIFLGSKVLLYTFTSMPFPLAPSSCHSPNWSPWHRPCSSKKGSPESHPSCKLPVLKAF